MSTLTENERALRALLRGALPGMGMRPAADDPTYSRGMQVPLIALLPVPEVRFERMKQILAQLSAQQERLGSDLAFFTAHATDIQSALDHLADIGFNRQQKCQQLLQQEPQLLRQLVLITTGALRQLAAQLDAEVEVCRTAARLADTLSWMVPMCKGRSDVASAASTPADAANLRMICSAGLLQAYTAAAQAATSFLQNNAQLLPRVDPALRPEAATIKVAFSGPHMLAGASTAMLVMWWGIGQLMPGLDLLQPDSLLLDTALPTASLAMALARAYAGDSSFCAAAMRAVMQASYSFARAAVPDPNFPATPNYGVLACPDVLELLLLGYAAGIELLHADSQGYSQQSLLPSLRTPGSTGGSSGPGNSSRRGSSSTAGSSSAPAAGKGSKPGRLGVSPHHRELLHALVGVRQLAGLHEHTAVFVLANVDLIPLAISTAGVARYRDAHGIGAGPHSVSRTTASAKQAVRAGELVPWRLPLPLHLAQVELLALAPPFFTDRLPMLQQLLAELLESYPQLWAFARTSHWERQPDSSPSLATVKSQAQLCAQSVWLELGPVLLSLCRRHSGEAAADDAEGSGCRPGPTLAANAAGLGATPRQVFATFSAVLTNTFVCQESNEACIPIINLAAVVEQNPVLAYSVLEAALHAAPAFSSRDANYTPGTTCYLASIAVDFMAEAAATRQAVAPTRASSGGSGGGSSSSSSSRLDQQLMCLLVAALKYLQFSAALTRSAPGSRVLHIYYNSCALFCACSSAALRVLGDLDVSRVHLHGLPAPTAAAAVQLSSEQQLLWFHALGRALVAAGALLQQVPERVSANGTCLLTDHLWPMPKQYKLHNAALRLMVVTVVRMRSMLQQGGAAAAAVAAGAAAAAATPADLSRLLQQAADLQQQLIDIYKMFCPSDFDASGNWAPRSSRERIFVFPLQMLAAFQQLHAACTGGGLPQQLRSFGVACCAAFPQRGVCGNGACTSLEKFSETALASQGCSGCNKAVKFCSAACHKTAWKEGHKAACAVLKQRGAAAEPSGS